MSATAADVLIRECDKTYHSKAKEHLSSHQLADFRKCPQLYHKKKLGLIENEDRPAYLLGRATHTLILEGRAPFDQQYVVGGPINPKTGKSFGSNTKAFAEWAEAQGKPVLTQEQFDSIFTMRSSVFGHELAAKLISSGLAEGVLRTNYCGLKCQTRMDWFNPDLGIVDLKTCDDLTWFESDARRFGYAYQLAFYQAVLRQATGLNLTAHMVAVEKKEPFRCGVWTITEQTLSYCQRENEAAIERLKICEATGRWPTGYEEPRAFDAI